MSVPIQPVILLGGSGTRLWPLSRKGTPKQFLALTGGRSMFQETLARLAPDDPALFARLLPPILVGSADHDRLAAGQMAAMDIAPAAIVCEPVARNTAPAFAAAAAVSEEMNPGALLLLLPADHHIADTAAFHACLAKAADAAAAGRLVTFGIVPDRAETGYGYIRKGDRLNGHAGVHHVDAFVEKPNRATAQGYVASGDYLWNSGMFVFHAGTARDDLARFKPELAARAADALVHARRDGAAIHLDAERFAACPADSIDYAIMERTDHACVVPSDFGWSDVGSFETLWEMGPHDGARNRLTGDVVAVDTSRTFVDARSRLVATFGVEDLVIVETGDAVLIARRERVQDLKSLVDRLKAAGRKELD